MQASESRPRPVGGDEGGRRGEIAGDCESDAEVLKIIILLKNKSVSAHFGIFKCTDPS